MDCKYLIRDDFKSAWYTFGYSCVGWCTLKRCYVDTEDCWCCPKCGNKEVHNDCANGTGG